MAKMITLMEVSMLIDEVIDSVFTEVDGVMDYTPEHLEVAKAYYKVYFFAKDKLVDMGDKDDIYSFYINYLNGGYKEVFANEIDIRQNEYIDRAIEQKIEFKQRQAINPISYALTRLINTINITVKTQGDKFKDIDVQKLTEAFSAMGDKFDMEKVIEILIDKKYPNANEQTPNIQMNEKKEDM